MSFTIYLIGFLILIGGLALAASRMGVSQTWIIIGALVLLGLGILTGAVKTRRRDPSEPAP
jgi:hypothetical protein